MSGSLNPAETSPVQVDMQWGVKIPLRDGIHLRRHVVLAAALTRSPRR